MNTVDIYGDKKVIADIINNEFEGEFVDDTFTSVRGNLFRDCTGLTKVTCVNATTIGQNAFDNTGITEIADTDFPNVTTISSQAFRNCANLRKVTFSKPTTLDVLSNQNQFDGCTNLEVYFPNLVTLTGDNAGDFLGTATIPDILPKHFPKLTTLGGNYKLRHIYVNRFISLTITYIGYRCFAYCYNTLRVFRAPNANLHSEAFYTTTTNFEKLRLVDIKNFNGSSFPANFLYANGTGTAFPLETLIIRSITMIPLASTTGGFVKRSNLLQGRSGIDILVPSALISEYQQDTNWSVLYGYGTARFLPLETAYDGFYADPDYDYDTGMED